MFMQRSILILVFIVAIFGINKHPNASSYVPPPGSQTWEWIGNACTPNGGFCGGPPGHAIHIHIALSDSYIPGTPLLNGVNDSDILGVLYWSPAYTAVYDPIADPDAQITTLVVLNGFSTVPDTPTQIFLEWDTPLNGYSSYLQTDEEEFDPSNPNSIDSFYSTTGLASGSESGRHAINWSPTVVPVPAALPLFLTALAGLGFIARRKSQVI